MRREISNMDDVIDSRDVIARIEALQEERQDLLDQIDTDETAIDDFDDGDDSHVHPIPGMTVTIESLHRYAEASAAALVKWDDENKQELDALLALQDEASGSPDWQYGEGLIRHSYFKDYAQDLAEDCGLLENANTWPGRCIDWDQAAEELKMDYFSVDFDGVEYLIRS